MLGSLLWDLLLSVPLFALLAYLAKRRYSCGLTACVAAFLLGESLVAAFSLTGITPMSGFHPDIRFAQIRLIPFADFDFSASPDYVLANLLGNLILLSPFALLTALLFPEQRRLGRLLLIVFLLSLLIELMQLFTLRATDTTDLLLNTAGTIPAYLVYRFMNRFFPRFTKELEIPNTNCMIYSFALTALLYMVVSGCIRMIFI